MSTVRRGEVAADNFVTVSNAFVRDGRLSLKARMLGVWLMSHRNGWSVSVETIAKTIGEKDGVTAIKSGLIELEQAGYLVREQSRDGSRFGGADYVISDVPAGETVGGKPASGEPRQREIDPYKKTIPQEDHLEETPAADAASEDGALFDEPEHVTPSKPSPVAYSSDFEQAWVAYGRKGAKRKAWAEWQRAIKRAPVAVIAAGIEPYQATVSERKFIKDFERYLSGDVWEAHQPGPAVDAPTGLTAEQANEWLYGRWRAADAVGASARTGIPYHAPHPRETPKTQTFEEFQRAHAQSWIKNNSQRLRLALMGFKQQKVQGI